MKLFLTKFHYKNTYNPQDVLVFAGLFVPSLVYLGITKARNFLYNKGWLKTYKNGAYVISVGNLTTGGTGKTPITAEIVKYLVSQNYKTAILSRGYGGKLSNKDVNIISDGKDIFYSSVDAGDEPCWLAQNCSGAYVLTCASRVKAAEFAYKDLKCSRIVLDDGYQHRKLQRDFNILVVDVDKKFSNGCLLPMGALRESMEEVKRANAIIVTNKNFNDRSAKTYSRYLRKRYKKPVYVCSLIPDKLYNLKDNNILDDANISPSFIAFSAIGQPEQFYSLIRRYDVIETVDFPDHHVYTKEDINKLQELRKKLNVDYLITTEKDAVKIREITQNTEDIFVLKLKPELDVATILATGDC